MYKDEVLVSLSERGNIAQFVSFAPDLKPRFARLFSYQEDSPEISLTDLATKALESSCDASVNVRSFEPNSPKSKEFVYGLKNVSDVVENVTRLASQGLTTIVNETIDIMDGGVSGVHLNGVLEFAPQDIPRCVEKPGICSLPSNIGVEILSTVYGFYPQIDYTRGIRTEWSLHPVRKGLRNEHTILWEQERVEATEGQASLIWPNRFSKFLGDKVFGLLMAAAYGVTVPFTTVFSRNVAPFSFGYRTGTNEYWIRTCPFDQTPGKFTTQRGWIDPFALFAKEDPTGEFLGAVLSQEGVDAAFSGACIAGNEIIIEGVEGFGDSFMVGSSPADLPHKTRELVTTEAEANQKVFGPNRFEWVQDIHGVVWTVQLHKGSVSTNGNTIVPGVPVSWVDFEVGQGLESLRALIAEINGNGQGIVLVGGVGVTSHFGDILRKANVPSYVRA